VRPSTPQATRRAHPAGTPQPSSRIKRLRYHKAHRWTTPAEVAFHARKLGAYYAVTGPTWHLPRAAWRSKDRTALALIPLAWLLSGRSLLWTLAALPIALLGYGYYRPRSARERLRHAEQRRLAKAVIVPPKVLRVTECHAPVLHRPPRGDKVRVGPLVLEAAPVAQLLDRVRPLTHRPELISKYLTLRVPPHLDPDTYRDMEDVISNTYDQPVEFPPFSPRLRRVLARIEYIDWLARVQPWERLEHPSPERIHIGTDRDGRRHFDSIADQAWLIGGCRGSGKSAFLRGVVGHLHDMHRVRLWLGDHLGDLRDFRRSAHEWASDVEGTLALLDRFLLSHATAYASLELHDVKALHWPEHEVNVLVLDEGGALTAHRDPGVRRHVEEALYIVATQGRKTQHSLIFATQHPDADHLPTSIRGQFTRRLGLRCLEATEGAMILGKLEHLPNLCAIPERHPGRGYWRGAGRALELRTPGLYDDDLSWLVGERTPRGPGGKYRQAEIIDVRETAANDGAGVPPTPLTLVPPLTEKNREERLLTALANAPAQGFTAAELRRLTDIPESSLYRRMKAEVRRGRAEVVRHDNPRTWRLRRAA